MGIFDLIVICAILLGMIYFVGKGDMSSANFCFLIIILIYNIHIKNTIDNLKK